MTTPESVIDQVEAVLDAATPGPWTYKYGSLYPPAPQPGAEPMVDFDGRSAFYGIWPVLSGENAERDAAAVLLAMSLMPAALAVVRAAEEVRSAAEPDIGYEGEGFDCYVVDTDALVALRAALDTFRSHVTELLPEEE